MKTRIPTEEEWAKMLYPKKAPDIKDRIPTKEVSAKTLYPDDTKDTKDNDN